MRLGNYWAMPVAIDSSVLIALEREGGISGLFCDKYSGPFFIPAHAAAEFLVGAHLSPDKESRERAWKIYGKLRHIVEPFTEADAHSLAELNVKLRRSGQKMKLYDAAIAAGCIAGGHSILTLDSDYDRLDKELTVLRYTPVRA